MVTPLVSIHSVIDGVTMTARAEFWFELLQAIGALATAVGVGIAASQLKTQKEQQRTDFEDRLTEQYRAILASLPLDALLENRGEDVDPGESLHAFYRYFDLSNEQIFLAKKGRISAATWETWKEGICDNMRRKAFADAWSEIAAAAPTSFDELRELVPPRPVRAMSKVSAPRAERPRPGAEVVMPDDAVGRVLAIRKATNSSWSNLRKAVAALGGDRQVSFGTVNVENTSKSIVRRMMRETNLALDDLARLLNDLSGEIDER